MIKEILNLFKKKEKEDYIPPKEPRVQKRIERKNNITFNQWIDKIYSNGKDDISQR